MGLCTTSYQPALLIAACFEALESVINGNEIVRRHNTFPKDAAEVTRFLSYTTVSSFTNVSPNHCPQAFTPIFSRASPVRGLALR